MRRYLAALLMTVYACTPPPNSSRVRGPTAVEAAATSDSALVAPENVWTWLPMSGTECADGSSTGLGLNLRSQSDRLVIFLEGGGVCSSKASCDPNDHPTAMHLGGFGETEFADVVGHAEGILKRADASNPLATASYALIPYCTGDLHMGDAIAPYGAHHRGYANLGLLLRHLVPTFAHVKQVVLAGSSAGGLGALWNWYRVQQAFGETEVVLLDDSGPFLGPPLGSLPPAQGDPWGAARNLPPGCDGCWPDNNFGHGPFNLFGFYAHAMPKRRGMLVSSTRDHEMGGRMGLDGAGFKQALNDLTAQYISKNPNFHVYFIDSPRHVWLSGTGGSLSEVHSGGVALGDFIAQGLHGDPNWHDVRPAQ